ncbi:MAG: FtsW/RodA/SpoVE family cell cycle protein [Barnesiella sp.]|nr:FtsW/RodA/SpoVE family cell cycle protein [Bacteroidales bacterium]MBD5248970.1 FtsW/RodA/SpoVE family cell cycle protein [Barnesiella sp.]MDE6082084.1 FtsW/RodA/SpoVE family cell cycle protein [Muribaculaceae bacterium]
MSEATAKPTAEAAPVQKVRKPDKYIWAIYIGLCFISIIELYSASSFEVRANNVFLPLIRHVILLGVGAGIVYVVSRINYRWCIIFTPIFIIVSVLLAGYVLFAGEVVNGARRSLTIFGFMLQPAEFLKLSAVLAISLFMTKFQGENSNKGIIYSGVAVLLFGGLLFFQGLTNTILLMGISISMMIIGGIPWRKLGILFLVYGAFAVCGVLVKTSSESKRAENSVEAVGSMEQRGEGRIATWEGRISRFLGSGDTIPKYRQPIDGTNAQEMYSYMAQAHGGVVGVMPGNSRETSRLPLAFSDFIYSIVVEEFGFVGGFLLLMVYLSLLARAGNIASRCKRSYPALLVIGMAVFIVLQALIHMAIVVGVSPVSGQPLPLISKGGSSILITSLAFGIMLSVSRFAARNDQSKEIKAEGDLLPEELHAENPAQLHD